MVIKKTKKESYVREVVIKYKTPSIQLKDSIMKPEDIYNVFVKELGDELQESAWVLCLSTALKVMSIAMVSRGNSNSAPIDARDIFRPAVVLNAQGVVIVHNHPSGNLTPSVEDKAVSNRLAKAGSIVGVELVDFVVVSSGGFVSFRALGVLGC